MSISTVIASPFILEPCTQVRANARLYAMYKPERTQCLTLSSLFSRSFSLIREVGSLFSSGLRYADRKIVGRTDLTNLS